jgi:hypothetical protein
MTEPTSTSAYQSDMIEALAAEGPFNEYADKLMLFGRLVGGWNIEGRHFNPEGQVTKEQRGEWHFGWVLEGRAIQDVILTPPRRAPQNGETGTIGTAIRFYDLRDAWRDRCHASLRYNREPDRASCWYEILGQSPRQQTLSLGFRTLRTTHSAGEAMYRQTKAHGSWKKRMRGGPALDARYSG